MYHLCRIYSGRGSDWNTISEEKIIVAEEQYTDTIRAETIPAKIRDLVIIMENGPLRGRVNGFQVGI